MVKLGLSQVATLVATVCVGTYHTNALSLQKSDTGIAQKMTVHMHREGRVDLDLALSHSHSLNAMRAQGRVYFSTGQSTSVTGTPSSVISKPAKIAKNPHLPPSHVLMTAKNASDTNTTNTTSNYPPAASPNGQGMPDLPACNFTQVNNAFILQPLSPYQMVTCQAQSLFGITDAMVNASFASIYQNRNQYMAEMTALSAMSAYPYFPNSSPVALKQKQALLTANPLCNCLSTINVLTEKTSEVLNCNHTTAASPEVHTLLQNWFQCNGWNEQGEASPAINPADFTYRYDTHSTPKMFPNRNRGDAPVTAVAPATPASSTTSSSASSTSTSTSTSTTPATL